MQKRTCIAQRSYSAKVVVIIKIIASGKKE